MELSPELWAAILGAIVGAIAAGGISYFLQKINLDEARHQRIEEVKERQSALAHSLLFKMMRIHTNIVWIHFHMEDAFKKLDGSGNIQEPWQVLLPIVNTPDRIQFSPDEMAMLLRLKNDDVFNAMASMDTVNNMFVAAITMYNTGRAELSPLLVGDVEGTVLTVGLDPDQFRIVRPKMLVLNSLAELMRVEAARRGPEAENVLNSLQELFRRELGLKYRLERRPDVPAFKKEEGPADAGLS